MTTLSETGNHLEKLLREAVGDSAAISGLVDPTGKWEFEPAYDVKETADYYEVFVDLPGVDEDALLFHCDGKRLAIGGSREFEHDIEDAEEFTRIERPYGTFRCEMSFESQVEGNRITAKYKRGVLKIRLPKTKRARAGESDSSSSADRNPGGTPH